MGLGGIRKEKGKQKGQKMRHDPSIDSDQFLKRNYLKKRNNQKPKTNFHSWNVCATNACELHHNNCV